MGVALLGVCYGHRTEQLRSLVRASSRLTHADPKAEHGALAVALAAWFVSRDICDRDRFCHELQSLISDGGRELVSLTRQAADSAAVGQETEQFAAAMGLGRGVSGYVNHTIPVALHAWFRHAKDYRRAVLAAVQCGGDTDTMAAITGAMVGAGVSKTGIPQEWLDALCEWPRTVAWTEGLGQRLAEVCADGAPRAAVRLPLYAVALRNAVFLVVIVAHALRRLLPPY